LTEKKSKLSNSTHNAGFVVEVIPQLGTKNWPSNEHARKTLPEMETLLPISPPVVFNSLTGLDAGKAVGMFEKQMISQREDASKSGDI
jgi:hypothetical protein